MPQLGLETWAQGWGSPASPGMREAVGRGRVALRPGLPTYPECPEGVVAAVCLLPDAPVHQALQLDQEKLLGSGGWGERGALGFAAKQCGWGGRPGVQRPGSPALATALLGWGISEPRCPTCDPGLTTTCWAPGTQI